MHVKKHIGFNGLRNILSKRFAQCPDPRSRNGKHALHDCLMSAFAMMFYQDPSLLQFQKRLQDVLNKNNLSTLFGVSDVPGDTQLRDIIDACGPGFIEIVFSDFFAQMQRGKQLEAFQVLGHHYFIPLDGTEYFSSEKIQCPQCLRTKHAKCVRYHHQILQAAIVCPGQKQVIPLAPEPIQNADGMVKQDCEINAGKRILRKIRKAHPKLRIIIGGDGLFSKQPFIDALKDVGMSYVLVAKPLDHKILFEWVRDIQRMKQTHILSFTDEKKREHRYEWVNSVPLNGTPDADMVGFFEYHMRVDGNITFHNSWVTDIPVTRDNIVELVKLGRTRWKIENETFNTLKNQGYHIEHNFGHGQKNLSYNFFLLNLLAFFFHQILERTDLLYQRCRLKFSSRREYWNQLRCTIRILLFQTWEQLLWLIIDPENNRPP